jgi:hypothetical protein
MTGDEPADVLVDEEIAPAEDAGDEAEPPRMAAPEVGGDGERLVTGQEAVDGG